MGVALYTEKTITGGKVGGVPGAMVTEQNGVRLFGCAKGGFLMVYKVVEQKSGNYPTSQPQPSPSAP